MNAQIIAVVNQKGGVGKSTTCANLGVGLAQAGKKVLVVDADPQASLSISLGHHQPDNLPVTLSDMMGKVLTDQTIAPGEGILRHPEGIDLMPSNIELSGMEVSLVNAMSRETILRQYLHKVKRQYTHILIDCQPSLGMLTVNALCAADSILVPVQCEYFALEGLSDLMNTVRLVRRSLNPSLELEGVLLTMFDGRTNLSLQVEEEVKHYFPGKVYASVVPRNIRLSEAPSHGKPISAYDRASRGADAYAAFAAEFIK